MEYKSGCWAEINLDNIGHNLNALKGKLSENTKVCCVVKANAYGCGAVEIAKYLQKQNIDFLAVARIEEAIELRENKIHVPILCLGYTDISFFKRAIENNISLTVYDLDYALILNDIAKYLNKKARIHIKIDTGMGRLGFLDKDAVEPIRKIAELDNIIIEGIFTHFAKADEVDKTITIKQITRFKKVISSLEKHNINIEIKHVSNSAATIDLNECGFNMVRLGIALYGYYPSEEVNKEVDLKPCLKLKSIVTNVKIVDKNVGISYGHTYKTNKKTKIITISIGYADGFNRVQETPLISVNGELFNIVGRICMDQAMAEVPIDFEVSIGDVVTIIDENIQQLTVESNALRNKTINYEILCMINRRVTRMYLENEYKYIKSYLID